MKQLKEPISISKMSEIIRFLKKYNDLQVNLVNKKKRLPITPAEVIDSFINHAHLFANLGNQLKELELFFQEKSELLSTYRKLKFAHKEKSASTENSNDNYSYKEISQAFDFKKDIEYISLFQTLSMYVDNTVSFLSSYIIDIVNPTKNEKRIMKWFEKLSPLHTEDAEKEKTYIITLNIFAQTYKTDILKLTFAIRANYLLEKKRKEITYSNSKKGTNIPQINQTSLRNKLGLNKSTVSDFFIGKKLPSTEYLLIIADELGVTADSLVNPKVELKSFTTSNPFKSIGLDDRSLYLLTLLKSKDFWGSKPDFKNADLILTTLNLLIKDTLTFRNTEEELEAFLNPNSILYLIGRFLYEHLSTSREQGTVTIVDNEYLNNLQDLLQVENKEDIPLSSCETIISDLLQSIYTTQNTEEREDVSSILLDSIFQQLKNTLKERQKELNQSFNVDYLVQQLTYDDDINTSN